MIRNEFPDLQWLKQKAEARFSRSLSTNCEPFGNGWPSVVLNVKSDGCYRDNIRGPLSLFTNVSGESLIEVEGKRTLIREGFFFISNTDQRYTLEIPEHKSTETFNVHFGEAFLEEAASSLTRDFESLLENPASYGQVSFYNRLNYRHPGLSEQLRAIAITGRESSMRFEEGLYDLAATLLSQERDLHKRISNIPVAKESTRKEMMKRILDSVDFMYENFHRDLGISDLAMVTSLSKFHFLRMFRNVFGKTPAQYLGEIRIEKAKQRLESEDTPVGELAAGLGYRNASSFSRMFRNQLGVYPTQYRALQKKK